MQERTISPFARPFYIMAKPAGAACNLACRYCYYLEKSRLYADDSRHMMSDEMLERFTKEYIEAQATSDILFTWHGGETLLRPIAFYEKAIALQRRYGLGRNIDNAIQTNGTLIDERWAQFFADNGWLVGVSIDGPEAFHDEYRRSRQGEGSFARVMRGIEILNRYGVQWNAMAVVNNDNGSRPLEFYRFFKSIGCHYLQFTPVVERALGHADGRNLAAPDEESMAVTAFSVGADQWGDFLCAVFDEWVRTDVGDYFVQLFDATLANWVGVAPGICSMAPTCGQVGVMEYNGDVYSCDHFVFPEYRLGNIRDESLYALMHSDRQRAFGAAKRETLPRQCRECEYLFACNGECPKNRFSVTADGDSGLNYLCRGYKKFFHHVAPYMDFMANELRHDRAPANVIEAIRRGWIDTEDNV